MSQILLGTINTGFGCIFQREKQVSIPLGTINTRTSPNVPKHRHNVSIPLGTINTPYPNGGDMGV